MRVVRGALALVVLLTAASAAVSAQQPPAPQRPVTIRELAVQGHRRIQEAVILGAVKSRVGGPFNPSILTEDIRAIFALGFFDDVQMRIEDFEGGVKVTFVVTERPFIRDVDFVGSKKVSTEVLRDKADIKLGRVYNPVEVQRAREKLREHYEEEGYFEAQVTPTSRSSPTATSAWCSASTRAVA